MLRRSKMSAVTSLKMFAQRYSRNIRRDVTEKISAVTSLKNIYTLTSLKFHPPWLHSKNSQRNVTQKISTMTSLKKYPLWCHSKNIRRDVTQKIFVVKSQKNIHHHICQKFSRDITQNISAVSVTKKYPSWRHLKHIHCDVTQKISAMMSLNKYPYPPWSH